MAVEIERKFLLTNDSWREIAEKGTRMSQGYLSRQRGRTVRVRVAGEQAWLTIKGESQGISRAEFEYAIPVAEAEQLLELCEPSVIDKTRYAVPFGGHVWEVDVFHGENEGLFVAEIELADENESFEKPTWVGEDVSEDRRYANSVLSVTPFKAW
jgi:adenylate cyclase